MAQVAWVFLGDITYESWTLAEDGLPWRSPSLSRVTDRVAQRPPVSIGRDQAAV